MNILFVASEVDPFAKTGGLADVASALPKALAALGHEVRIIMPLYRQVHRERCGLRATEQTVSVPVGPRILEGRLWEAQLPTSRVQTWFIEQPSLFDRDGLYQDRGSDYTDNLSRFSFFSQAALQMLPGIGWQPEIVHCHDWQAALACAHLARGALGREAFFAPMRTVLTIHNLAYQGVFPKEQWPLTQLPDQAFGIQGLELYGQINCLKGGLVFADALTTVSPTYASEIQQPEYGCGLEGVLQERRQDLVGMTNGIDQDAWNPQTDPHLAAHYSAKERSGKAVCKLTLQQRHQLPTKHHLLIGMIQRLAEQKGIDIFAQAVESLTALPVQLVLLGTGDPTYHEQLQALAAKFPDRLAVTLAFDNALAHQIEAGADAFLMPSRFEPCGLNQMYSMRYGTVPIARRVGGLADTVVDVDHGTRQRRTATGFLFTEYSAAALLQAVRRALAAYEDHALWAQLMTTGMTTDFSWSRSATEYVRVYERIHAARRAHHA